VEACKRIDDLVVKDYPLKVIKDLTG